MVVFIFKSSDFILFLISPIFVFMSSTKPSLGPFKTLALGGSSIPLLPTLKIGQQIPLLEKRIIANPDKRFIFIYSYSGI